MPDVSYITFVCCDGHCIGFTFLHTRSSVVPTNFHISCLSQALIDGHNRKKFAATAMNDRSSRSHTAFVIQVLQKLNSEKLLTFNNADVGVAGHSVNASLQDTANDKLLKSQLHLVDLAGSERIKKSKVTGKCSVGLTVCVSIV